jgi:hypothetical protein
VSALLLHHIGVEELDAEDRAMEHNIVHPLPILGSMFVERTARGDSSVANKEIDGSKFLHNFFVEINHGIADGDITDNGQNVECTRVFDFFGCGVELLLVRRCDDNFHLLCCEF